MVCHRVLRQNQKRGMSAGHGALSFAPNRQLCADGASKRASSFGPPPVSQGQGGAWFPARLIVPAVRRQVTYITTLATVCPMRIPEIVAVFGPWTGCPSASGMRWAGGFGNAVSFHLRRAGWLHIAASAAHAVRIRHQSMMMPTVGGLCRINPAPAFWHRRI